MSRLQRIETWPPQGFPERMWDSSAEGPGDPLVDAFARASRPVAELYSEALAGLGLEAQRRVLRLYVTRPRDDARPDQVVMEVWRDQRGMRTETGFVRLGGTVSRLGSDARARLALDVIHAGARLLVEARGGDPTALDACREHVEASAFTFVWSSSWKASPDRRHQARACYRMSEPDGFARVRLELRRRGDQEAFATSPPALASCTVSGLRSSAGTLRWADGADVSLVPFLGSARTSQGLLAAHIEDSGAPVFHVRNDVTTHTPGIGLQEDLDAPVPPVTASFA